MKKFLKFLSAVAFIVLVFLLSTRTVYQQWSTESNAWEYAVNQDSKWAYNKYLEKYPTGSHVSDARNAISVIDREAEMESAYSNLVSSPTLEKCQNFLDAYPNSPYENRVKKKLNNLLLEEVNATYGNNSLRTGATPYSKWYGDNYSGLRYNFSTIKVTGPISSDVIIIIKRNNADGEVAAHGYISAGETLSLDLPNGRYQTFFYYGRGWYPGKQMPGVRGGFLKDEVFSKANSENLSDVELSYVLQLTTNGNFSTKTSSSSEIF